MSTASPPRGSRKMIDPLTISARFDRMPRIACEVTDLPEPDSPTTAKVRPGMTSKRDRAHGMDDAGIRVEVDAQVANAQKWLGAQGACPRQNAATPASLVARRSRFHPNVAAWRADDAGQEDSGCGNEVHAGPVAASESAGVRPRPRSRHHGRDDASGGRTARPAASSTKAVTRPIEPGLVGQAAAAAPVDRIPVRVRHDETFAGRSKRALPSTDRPR